MTIDEITKKRDDIIRKLQAMIAMSQGTANAEEAASAAAKAQEWMLRFNIGEEELRPTSADNYIEVKYSVASVDGWQRRLLMAVGHANFCKVLYFKRRHRGTSASAKVHIIIGEPVNIEATKLMFEYLDKTLRRLGIEAHNEVIIAEEGSLPRPLSRDWLNHRRRWVDAFYAGALLILERRLAALRRELERGQVKRSDGSTVSAAVGTALVVVKDAALERALDRFQPERSESKWQGTSRGATERPGFSEGIEAGRGISLNKQIASGK